MYLGPVMYLKQSSHQVCVLPMITAHGVEQLHVIPGALHRHLVCVAYWKVVL